MKLYILIILSHIVGDVFLQKKMIMGKVFGGKNLHQLKRQHIKYLFIHVTLYSLCVTAVIVSFNLFTVPKLVIVFVSHFFIDYFKCYKFTYKRMSVGFLISNTVDQLAHFITLISIVTYF